MFVRCAESDHSQAVRQLQLHALLLSPPAASPRHMRRGASPSLPATMAAAATLAICRGYEGEG